MRNIQVVIGALAMIMAGCAQRSAPSEGAAFFMAQATTPAPQPHPNPRLDRSPKSPLYTKALRDQIKFRNPKPPRERYARLEPEPAPEPLRVKVVKHQRPGRTLKGKYVTLSREESDYDDVQNYMESARRWDHMVVPDVVIYNGWLYISGDAPHVGTTAVVAQAEGCKLLLYYYQLSEDETKYCRVCYLEGDSGALVWIYPQPSDRAQPGWLGPGMFADAVLRTDGSFERWMGTAAPNPPNVRQLDELDPKADGTYADPSGSYHYSVLNHVAQGRYTEPVD